jgi:hypothetical protein
LGYRCQILQTGRHCGVEARLSNIIDHIIFALELKSLTVAPSSFFCRLASRAAANVMGPPEKFAFQACHLGPECPRSKKRNLSRTVDVIASFNDLTEVPEFNPNDEELAQLLTDARIRNDDRADNSGVVQSGAGRDELSNHPRVHIALQIMRTVATSLSQDTDDWQVRCRSSHGPRSSTQISSPPLVCFSKQPHAITTLRLSSIMHHASIMVDPLDASIMVSCTCHSPK